MPWNRWQPSHGISGSFAVESVAGLLWNQWQHSYGTDGSFAVESVAGFTWNRWQLWRGIRRHAQAAMEEQDIQVTDGYVILQHAEL